jgi:AcrR family transcriptional regulator
MRPYRPQRASRAADRTRERIVAAVRTLLEEGRFHESTVAEVAARAGVARATLYQHFNSRIELIDAICDAFAASAELRAIRDAVELADPRVALDATVAAGVRFWSSEEALFAQLYGVAALDPAARHFVERQRADRRGEMRRLTERLRAAGALEPQLDDPHALALLLVLTSFESYRELRRQAGLDERDTATTLQASARRLLIAAG